MIRPSDLPAPDRLPDRPPPPGYRDGAVWVGIDARSIDTILAGARRDKSYAVAQYLEARPIEAFTRFATDRYPESPRIPTEDYHRRQLVRRRCAFSLRPEHGYYAWDAWTADDGTVAFTSDPDDTRWVPNPGATAYVWRWVRDTMTAHRQQRAAVHDEPAAAAFVRGELLARFVPLDREVDRAVDELVALRPTEPLRQEHPMTPAQHAALARIVDADRRGAALKIDRDNTAATVAEPTAEALIRRDLADRTRIRGQLGTWIIPTDAGRRLAATSTPIGETR